jgi:hypothetical protein
VFERENTLLVGNRRNEDVALWITGELSVHYPPVSVDGPVFHTPLSVFHPLFAVYYPPRTVYHPPAGDVSGCPTTGFGGRANLYLLYLLNLKKTRASYRCSPPLGVRFAPPAGSSGLTASARASRSPPGIPNIRRLRRKATKSKQAASPQHYEGCTSASTNKPPCRRKSHICLAMKGQLLHETVA